MATTDKIIDACLKAINEEDTVNPVGMSRADVLDIINHLYQNDIGRRIKTLVSYTYDASDAAHTITAGIGTLPPDFLLPAEVYDGDAPEQETLEQIFSIKDKVENDAATKQFLLPDNSSIWIFGQTPTNDIKLYYYKQPVVLTDANTSSPADLRTEYHLDVFKWATKKEYALRQNNTNDVIDCEAYIQDYLKEIERAHTAGKQHDAPGGIVDVYGGCG